MTSRLFGNFGFINRPPIKLASNTFIPLNLIECVTTCKSLSIVGNNKGEITGGGISFDRDEAIKCSLGEYLERYSSSFQNNAGLIKGSFIELNGRYKCYDPNDINYFSSDQYLDPSFGVNKLTRDTSIHWIKTRDYFTDETILLPFFMVNLENIKGEGRFHINTSTGTASHINTDEVIKGGLMECVERDAFCKFWYLQKSKIYRKFTSQFIVKQFMRDFEISSLFNNKKVKIVSFDVSELAYCPTFITFLFFKIKGRVFQSVGSGSRLNHRSALVKSCIEAYQGIEYVKVACAKTLVDEQDIATLNFKFVDNFKKHFALYNLFPHLANEVPILKHMFDEDNIDTDWQTSYQHHIKDITREELRRVGLDEVFYADLTSPDVQQMGFETGKVITPKLHLLTGDFNYPYLGLFEKGLDLMTEMPHPFP